MRYGYIIPILENLEIESQSKNHLPKVTYYVGSRTCIHAHVCPTHQQHALPFNRSICGGCSATHFQEHIGRIRTPTASELSRYLVTQFIGTFPSFPLGWPNIQVLIKEIWSVVIYYCFYIISLEKNCWSSTLIPFHQARSLTQCHWAHQQTKQYCRRGKKIKTEGSWVLRWPGWKEAPTHSGPVSNFWAIIQGEIHESLTQTTVASGPLQGCSL